MSRLILGAMLRSECYVLLGKLSLLDYMWTWSARYSLIQGEFIQLQVGGEWESKVITSVCMKSQSSQNPSTYFQTLCASLHLFSKDLIRRNYRNYITKLNYIIIICTTSSFLLEFCKIKCTLWVVERLLSFSKPASDSSFLGRVLPLDIFLKLALHCMIYSLILLSQAQSHTLK